MRWIWLLVLVGCEKTAPSVAPPEAPAPAPAPVAPAAIVAPTPAPPPAPTAPVDPSAIDLSITPRWILLGDHFKTHGPANLRANEFLAQGILATPVDTALFANLKPGFVAVVHGAFDDRGDAIAAADALKAKGVDVYVKNTGAANGRIVRVLGRAELGEGEPFTVTLAHNDEVVAETTAKDGWYQLWFLDEGFTTLEVSMDTDLEPRSGCHGWIRGGSMQTVSIPTTAASALRADVFILPDCCGE